jgi:hypothetical protein
VPAVPLRQIDVNREPPRSEALTEDQVRLSVKNGLHSTRCIDIHTHLYPPAFGKLGLWGIDELLTYHYLEAEFFRSSPMSYDEYWSLTKKQRADAIWRTLFVENTPISEATRGVIFVLNAFNLPTDSTDLTVARRFFREQTIDRHVDQVLRMSGVSTVVMTNDPLDPEEAPMWMNSGDTTATFRSVIRLDRLVREWSEPWQELRKQGYQVENRASTKSIKEIRRFLAEWRERMQPVYMAVSLPDSFHFPDDSVRGMIFREAVLPACREFNLPLSLMIGVRRQVNPKIRLAGDGVGRADLKSVETICRDFPENKFFVSVLSRENQHELCVLARKFNNLLPFGCWWFLNNPSIVKEITRERIEMLGMSFIPQHSDARVLEQLIYKWHNTRRTLEQVLTHSYQLLLADGRVVTALDIQNDLGRLFHSNFERWIGN